MHRGGSTWGVCVWWGQVEGCFHLVAELRRRTGEVLNLFRKEGRVSDASSPPGCSKHTAVNKHSLNNLINMTVLLLTLT